MLQKRLDYGFNGYQVPFVPRAARSARRRGPMQKKVEDNQMCAIDVLATVAGKLLLEGGSYEDISCRKDQAVTAENVVTKELCDDLEGKMLGHCDHVSAQVPSLSLELGLGCQTGNRNVNKISGPQLNIASALGSVITSSDCLEEDGSLDKIDLHDDKSELCSASGKQEGGSPAHVQSCLPDMTEYEKVDDDDSQQVFGNGLDMRCSEVPNFFSMTPPALVSSDRDVKLSLGQDRSPSGSFFPYRGNICTVVNRDDDENSSGCTHPSSTKMTTSLARIGDRRIRKLLASKYWRVAPKMKDGEFSDAELHCVYRSRKIGYKRQRSQRIYPFKKRKFHYSSFSNSDAGVYNSPKAFVTTSSGFGAVGRADGSSSCVAGQSTTFPSRESHVKLRIKSFRVPEFFIEMPETATIGSLKRTVMDTVTALLGGGLRVGVLLQGKKIRDDNRTLLQSGICHDDKVDSLGFTLEPNHLHSSQPVCSDDNSLLYATDVTEPVSRCPGTSGSHLGTAHVSSDLPVSDSGNLIESDHDSAPSPAELSAEKTPVDSRALVALPEGTPQALAVVQANLKSKRSDIGQRRIRRPFSVTEVEALVQAVEKLGTGRWRDVKLQAFDNVKHRTYVDLKDKWKTLVHTARISPQQRRGEPVPQELLDRVLAAHGYWSQQQAKQQLKQQSQACLLL